MFENSHLPITRFDVPLTHSNLQNYAGLPDISDEYKTLFNGSFCVDGYGYAVLVPTILNIDYTKQNLFFIKSFGLMYSKKNYYTRRINENSYLLLFTYDGKGSLDYEGKNYTLSKGEGFLIDCRKLHYYKSTDSHWTHVDLHFNGYLSDDLFQIFSKNNYLKFKQSCDGSFQTHLEELMELYTGLLPYREMLISQKLHSILTMLLVSAPFFKETTEKIPENLVYLLKYMQNSYHRHLTLDVLSDFSGISKPHLIRLFNRYVGCTPREYIMRLQLENAKQLLETTILPVKQIGIMVGIEDGNYFSRFFKARIGMGPLEWRNAHRI